MTFLGEDGRLCSVNKYFSTSSRKWYVSTSQAPTAMTSLVYILDGEGRANYKWHDLRVSALLRTPGPIPLWPVSRPSWIYIFVLAWFSP